jgi:hypothetical protein
VLPLLIAVVMGIGVWRSMQLYRRDPEAIKRYAPSRPSMMQNARSKRIAKRVALVVAAWIAVTGLVAFYRIDLALFAGMIVIVAGGIWIWKTADPMRIDMDELDKALMKLLEEENES